MAVTFIHGALRAVQRRCATLSRRLGGLEEINVGRSGPNPQPGTEPSVVTGHQPDPVRRDGTCHLVPSGAAYGLIEWDGSETPTLIVAAVPAAVRRVAVRLIANRPAGGQIAADDPTFNPPVPGADAADDDFTAWLTALHEATTVPWFTLYSDADLGCNLIIVAGQISEPGGPHAAEQAA